MTKADDAPHGIAGESSTPDRHQTSGSAVKIYEPTEHLLWLMKRVFHKGHRMVDRTARDFGVTASQVGMLNRVYAEPGISGAEMARRLFVTPQAAQLALSELARRGLIERVPDPGHRRILRASLTERGRQVVEEAMHLGLDAEAQLFAPLEPHEQQQLREYLQRLLDHDTSRET